MIDRKLWRGDVLNLAEGNSFWGMDVVHHRAGSAMVIEDSEIGDPLVEISGSYIVKRSDLSELNPKMVRMLTLASEIEFAGLRGNSREDCERFANELTEELKND